jgi:hypothetical protein
MIITDTRLCKSCGDQLKGRIDKKFCDDYCRNNFNNQQKIQEGYSVIIKHINSALLKNRKILKSLITEDTAKTTKEKLLGLGFQFKYLTHTYLTRNGKMYSYCYDYGYLPIGNDWYLVVKKKDD